MSIPRALRFLPILFAVIMAASLAYLRNAISTDHRQLDSRQQLLALTYEMRGVFDTLSGRAEAYARYGESGYLDAYNREHYELRSRDRIYQDICAAGATEKERMLAAGAVDCSYALSAYEISFFDAAGIDGLEAARDMLYSAEYLRLKNNVYNALDQFFDEFDIRYALDASRSRTAIEAGLLYVVLSALFIVLSALVYVFYAIHRRKNVERLAAAAARYVRGDLSADLSAFAQKDEQGTLASALSGLSGLIRRLDDEIMVLSEIAPLNNYGSYLDSVGYEGCWRDLAGRVNHLLRERESILISAPVAYIYVENDAVLYYNPFAEELLSLKAGARFSALFAYAEEYERFTNHIAGANAFSGFRASFLTSPGSGGITRCLLYLSRPQHGMAAAGTGADSHIAVWVTDIEELSRENALALRESDDFKRVAGALPMPVLLTDPQTTRIVYANMAYLRLFEAPQNADIIGFKESNLYDQNGAVPDENKTMEFRYKTHTGKRLDTRVSTRSVQFAGKTAALKIIQDLQDERRRIGILQNAADREREANSLKNRFLIGMSHEMRAPMNIIIGLSQLALLSEQSSRGFDSFQKINRSARGLMNVVDNLLDFTRLEDQKVDLTESEFNLEDIIANAFMLASTHIERKPVEMLLDIRPDVPYMLYGDKVRLWQVLKNLLDNAAKFTQAGHVVLRISVRQPISGKAQLQFEIEDTGTGMSAKQLENLFNPFKQADYDSYAHGAGLSMAVTKQMVDLMDGRISVTSAPGEGTRFRVDLPFQIADSEATIVQMLVGYAIRPAHILVVDGDEVSCNITERLLGQLGLIPVFAATGAEAMDAVSARLGEGKPFDLVITDYRLQDTTGIELARGLLNIQPSVKLIMVAAQLPEKNERLFDFVDILQKPLVPSAFVSSLRDALESGMPMLSTSLDTFENARVLLVEDNAINQEIGIEMLETLGITATVAGNGKEALDLLKKETFHAVLMDVIMPAMDGLEATRIIRRSQKPYRKIPILAMTAGVMPSQLEEYMTAGMNGYVGKPLEFETLSRELSRVLPPALRRHGARVMDYAHAGFDIEDVDVSSALARFGGDEARYRESLLKFADELSALGPYKDALDGRDDALAFCHKLISTASSLGALKLSRMVGVCINDLIERRPESPAYKDLLKAASVMVARINRAVKG